MGKLHFNVFYNKKSGILFIISLLIAGFFLVGTSGLANAASAADWYNRGHNYLQNNEYDNAIRAYTEAIAINPSYFEAYNNRGLCYYYKGIYDTAIDNFNKALEINPKHISSYNNRAIIYEKKGMYDQALIDLDKALSLNKNFYPTYANRANIYVHKGMYDQAIEDCNKGLSINSTIAEIYETRGNAYRLKGMYEQAIKDYDKALALNPKLKDANIGKEKAYKAMNTSNPAAHDFGKINQPLTLEDICLDGFRLGDLVDEAIRKYGHPDEVKEYDFIRARFVMYRYKGLLDVHYLKNNRRIWDISVYSPSISTTRNITVGHSVSDVTNLYGDKYTTTDTPQGNIIFRYFLDRNVYHSANVLSFEINRTTGKILKISIDNWED